MLLESTTVLSFGKWLTSKLADKGFDEVYKKVIKTESTLNSKFYMSVDSVSNRLQVKYPDILGGDIEYFFKKEDVFNELFKLLFRHSKIDTQRISENFDTRTIFF